MSEATFYLCHFFGYTTYNKIVYKTLALQSLFIPVFSFTLVSKPEL